MGQIKGKCCSFLFLTLISIKLFVIINVYIRRNSKIVNVINVEDVVFENENNSFVIMNEKNVTMLLRPPDCSPDTRLMLLVSSGHDNTGARSGWRRRLSEVTSLAPPGWVRLVFLVSSCPRGARCEADLDREHDLHGDILHTSLEDGHRRLGYKILSGYIWTHLSCGQASHVVKTDDNVLMDLPALLHLAAHPLPGDSVTCGAGTPHRNHKTLRSDKPHMTGNWSTSKQELEDDIMPDFCCGFSYITSPKVVNKIKLTLKQMKLFILGWNQAIEGRQQAVPRHRDGADRGRPHHRRDQGEGRGQAGRHGAPHLAGLGVGHRALSMSLDDDYQVDILQ